MSFMERRIEARIEKALVEAARELGGLAIKIAPVSFVGLPDRLILLPGGRALFVEVKSPGQTPTPLQLWWLDKLQRLGFVADWIDSVEQVDVLMRQERGWQAASASEGGR
jgi:hypothetical protein